MLAAEKRLRRRHVMPGSGLFIVLIASLMTITAMSIDINLPAIPETAGELGASLTKGQLTVTLFFVGFAFGQLLWGPASDRFGRKPAMLFSIACYVVTTIACGLARTMDELLALRVLQGLAAGGGAVLSRAMIRDLFEGAPMARVMSLALAAFVTAPIVAPVIGAALLMVGSWRLIFGFLAVYGVCLLVLALAFLPESLKHRNRDALRPSRFALGFRAIFGDVRSRSWAMVVIFAFATLTIYLANAPAIFMTSYGMSQGGFAAVFAVIAMTSALGNLANAQMVRRLALPRTILLGLSGASAAALATLVIDRLKPGSGWALVPSLAAFFFCFGLVIANGTALAMQPHGAIAGTATSALGVTTTLLPALIASAVAALYDGTGQPALGAILLCIALSLAVLLRRHAA